MNRQISQKRPTLLRDDHALVVRLGLHDRLGQRLEVSLPGIATLGEVFQVALDERHALTEFQLLFSHGVTPRRCVGCWPSPSYPNAPVQRADEPWRPLRHEARGEERPNILTPRILAPLLDLPGRHDWATRIASFAQETSSSSTAKTSDGTS